MISVIVAIAENNIIGKTGQMLPWRLSADLVRFKKITMGHPIIMGLNTFKTIGKALPGRKNIVISNDPSFSAPDCIVVGSINEAVEQTGGEDAFVVGGASIYRQMLPMADKLYLTVIHAKPDGDILFEFDKNEWREVSSEDHKADEKNQHDYTFKVLERVINL